MIPLKVDIDSASVLNAENIIALCVASHHQALIAEEVRKLHSWFLRSLCQNLQNLPYCAGGCFPFHRRARNQTLL